MPIPVYRSRLKGDDIASAAMKIDAMENTSAQTVNLPPGQDAYVDIERSQAGTIYTFGIPAGSEGRPGYDLYILMVRAGFVGTRQEFFVALLNLLEPPIPYEYRYMKRFTYKDLGKFTHEHLMLID